MLDSKGNSLRPHVERAVINDDGMAIQAIDIAQLKRIKNLVIGNPTEKLKISTDPSSIRVLIECLNHPQPDIRTEAAHITASLSYGSEQTLISLIQYDAPRALLYAMSRFTPADSTSLRSSITRAFRTLTVSLADVVGPSQWGLRLQRSFIRQQAKYVLGVIFHLDTLNIFLPLLTDPSSQVSIAIAQLLAGAIRLPEHRTAVAEWLPAAEKVKQAKARRGWEKPATVGLNTPNRLGGWVAKHLTDILKGRDTKLHEAALLALAALAKENTAVASALAKSVPDQPSVLSIIISHSRSRSTEVQIAACLCATHILRASTASSHPIIAGPTSANHIFFGDDVVAKAIISITTRLLTIPSTESVQSQIKACYLLHYLAMDELSLCQIVYERGGVNKLTSLLQDITKPQYLEAWDEDESENVSALREACLMALATLALSDDEIRRHLADFAPSSSSSSHHAQNHTDTNGDPPPLTILQIIQISLSHHHPGVRYAACQCVRAISRAVSVLRTSVMDCGVGPGVFGICMGVGAKKMIEEVGKESSGSSKGYWEVSAGSGDAVRKEKEKEKKKEKEKEKVKEEEQMDVVRGVGIDGEESDMRVLNAAVQSMCNLVTLHSPLRPIFLRKGLVKRLVELMHGPETQLKLNAIWVVKNLLTQSSLEMKEDVMDEIGWKYFAELLRTSEDDVKEHVFHVLRNIAEDENGVELLFKEIGAEELLGSVTNAIMSNDERVVLQAVHALANLANGVEEHKVYILSNPDLLKSLRICIAESRSDIRRPAVSCVYELTKSKKRKEIVDAGFVPTLKKVSEYSGVGMGSGVGGSASHNSGQGFVYGGIGGASGGGVGSASGSRSPLYGGLHGISSSPGAGGSRHVAGYPGSPGFGSSISHHSGSYPGPSNGGGGFGGYGSGGSGLHAAGLGMGGSSSGSTMGGNAGLSTSTIIHLEEEVVDQAKAALERLEHWALYTVSSGSP